jgi:TubC N-terminal docking domain
MSAAAIVSKAKALGIRLSLNGDQVKMRGPVDAIAAIKPEIAAHKPEVMAYLSQAANDADSLPADCVGALRDPEGGLYLPWVPHITPEQLKQWQRELFEAVDELARLEGWPDSDYDHVVMCIERQPISTLRPDLGYFRDRLEAARAMPSHCRRSNRTGDAR